MTVTARLFAAAAEAVGAHQLDVEARDVAELRASLSAVSESSAPIIRQCAVLEGGLRREDSHVLAEGSVVDVLPPFSGG